MATTDDGHRRLSAVRRDGEQVTALELFFDLVFVLAVTQCTAIVVEDPSLEGVARGLLVLGVIWWSWVGYAWLTSVVDPEEGAVRLAMFAAMAAFLVMALCVPDAFDDLGLTFAIAYAAVRAAHIALFVLASRDDPSLRTSVIGLAVSTTLGVGVLAAAHWTDGTTQGVIWAVAVLLDVAGPFLFGSEGWKLVPAHFAERHGLVLIIALGESVVAIGVGAEAGVDAGVVLAAVLGIVLLAALWWAYFDVVAILAGRALSAAEHGRVQNEMARDAYSFIHFPMVAGIVLIAFALESTIAHPGDPLSSVAAWALVGGAALFLLANVGFRLRTFGGLSVQRLVPAAALLALFPAARELPASATVALVATMLWLLVVYESSRWSEARDRIRHGPAEGPSPA